MRIRLGVLIVVVFLGGCATGYDRQHNYAGGRDYYNNSFYDPVWSGSYGYRGYPYPAYGGFLGFGNSHHREHLSPYHDGHGEGSHHGSTGSHHGFGGSHGAHGVVTGDY